MLSFQQKCSYILFHSAILSTKMHFLNGEEDHTGRLMRSFEISLEASYWLHEVGKRARWLITIRPSEDKWGVTSGLPRTPQGQGWSTFSVMTFIQLFSFAVVGFISGTGLWLCNYYECFYNQEISLIVFIHVCPFILRHFHMVFTVNSLQRKLF